MKQFDLDSAIRKVPDFPKPGILFYDITSVLANPEAFAYCVTAMEAMYANQKIDAVAAIESRGFLFAAPFAHSRNVPLLLVRKKGKLPGKTIAKKYALEYGEAEIEIHIDDVPQDGRILIVDDLVATGGTLRATADLLREGKANPIGIFCVIGLPFLHYDKLLSDIPVHTLINYSCE